jgi:hypothetical protein
VKKLKLMIAAVVALAMLAVPAGAMARDGDHDKMNDRWEKSHGLNVKKKDGALDPDKDGLKNLGEYRSRTNPHDADSDNDGREDGDEDRDRDGVDNGNEARERTSPTDRDSDDDGRHDGVEDRDRDGLNNRGEDRTGNDPMDRDTDDDGRRDGDEQSGTIVSYDSATKLLTINVTGTGPVSGRVTDATEIKCETEDEHEDDEGHHSAGASRHGADDPAGDDSRREGSDDDNREDNSGPGSSREHDGDEDNRCSEADLTAGTAVHEAELTGSGADAVWNEIELIK